MFCRAFALPFILYGIPTSDVNEFPFLASHTNKSRLERRTACRGLPGLVGACAAIGKLIAQVRKFDDFCRKL